MKIKDSFHRLTRIENFTIDPNDYVFIDIDGNNPLPPYQLPVPTEPHELWYHIKVQVRICFIWVTVWSVTVDLTDEAMAAANARAREIANTLNCTGL